MINKTLRGRKWDTKEGGEGQEQKDTREIKEIRFNNNSLSIYLIKTAKKNVKKKEQLSPVAYVDMYTHHFWYEW